jgi:hypothetical protein
LADGLTLAELALAVALVVALVPIVLLVARRRWLARSGWVFDCSLRRPGMTPRSRWMLGVARLNGELIEWYRVFSWSLRPKVSLRRQDTRASRVRMLLPDERALLFDQERVATLESDEERVELAMDPDRMTAFLSWLEAAPPGVGYR